jgi:dienelactone hydrolase
MKSSNTVRVVISIGALCTAFACGGSDDAPPSGADSPDSGVSLPGSEGGTRDGSAPVDSAAPRDGATPVDAGLQDPNADGPFTIAEKDATAAIAATGDNVAIHVAYPTAAGPFPVVILGHGFLLPPAQYASYLKRLATFGYVALTVDFPNSFPNDNPKQAKDLLGGIDWAKTDAVVGPKVDATKVGMSGHSLGGKLALLAATMDPRVKASFVLDPVDSGPNGCSPPTCVVVKNLLPTLSIPTGFLGETSDTACAPTADNFITFYAQSKAPSLKVTAIGASHMSFLDNVASCGLPCGLCQPATASNKQVNGMARSLMVAFYERYLRGDAAYDTYLTGADSIARYVTTGQATIVSK